MSRMSDLVKGFRYNIKHGYPTTLIFTGWHIHLTCEHPEGMVGIVRDIKQREVKDNELPSTITS